MKTIPFVTVVLSSFLIFLYGCNSKGYEIEEVEDYTDTSSYTSRNEIKQDIRQPNVEIKEETSKSPKQVTITYTIQIGAFAIESNATAFTTKAKSELVYDISCILMQGLYKIRFGNYSSKEEVYSILTKVRDLGYDDAFIIEIRR